MSIEKTIFIGNLPLNTNKNDLINLFLTFGDINDVKVNNKENYGFIEYMEAEDLEHAIENYNQTIYRGNIIKVEKARKIQKNLDKPIWEEENYATEYIKN